MINCHLHVNRIRSEHGLGLRPLAFGQQMDERLVRVRLGIGGVGLLRQRLPFLTSGAVQVARIPRDIGTSTGCE